MCQPKPGLRCSNHAREEVIKHQMKVKLLQNLGKDTTEAQKDLDEAQAEYDTTRRGLLELQESIKKANSIPEVLQLSKRLTEARKRESHRKALTKELLELQQADLEARSPLEPYSDSLSREEVEAELDQVDMVLMLNGVSRRGLANKLTEQANEGEVIDKDNIRRLARLNNERTTLTQQKFELQSRIQAFDESKSPAMPQWLEAAPQPESFQKDEALGIQSVAYSGLANKGFNERQLEGRINSDALTNDSWKELGFDDPYVNFDDIYYDDKRHALSVEENQNAREELKASGIRGAVDRSYLHEYSIDSYRHVNRTLRYKKPDQPWRQGEPGDFTEDAAAIATPSKADFEHYTSVLDRQLASGPGVQRKLYRGVYGQSEKFKSMFSSLEVGKEIVFDDYQSVSTSRKIATNFASSSSGGGVEFEIITSEGLNIAALSSAPEEREVVLPRESRYMVVGKHENAIRGESKLTGAESHIHVVQLIAIDEKGNILGPNTPRHKPTPLNLED